MLVYSFNQDFNANKLAIHLSQEVSSVSTLASSTLSFVDSTEDLSKAYVGKVPIDVLSLIFSFVDEPSTLSQVCYEWKKIINLSLIRRQEARLERLLGKELAKEFFFMCPPADFERFKQIKLFTQEYSLALMCSKISSHKIKTEADKIRNQVKNKDFSIEQKCEKLKNGIKSGILDKINNICLKNAGLIFLPPEIGLIKNLQNLDLSKNKLKTLPKEILQLFQLKYLDLSDNQLHVLPDQLQKLSFLQDLNISNNCLKALPSRINELSCLTRINLSDNKLNIFPAVCLQMVNLKKLHLSGNQIKELPGGIDLLENLETLYLERNQLETLPDTLWNLSKLTSLCLNNNLLKSISIKIGQLSQLKWLTLKNNTLEQLPIILVESQLELFEV